MESINFYFLFLTFLFMEQIVEVYLVIRNRSSIDNNRNQVPDDFIDSIQLKDHQKAGRYTQAKLLVSHFEVIFSTIVLLLWTLGGGLDWLDNYWSEKIFDPLLLGTTFIITIMLIASLIDIPFSIYRNFVLEQRFGFNRMTPVIFLSDIIKEVFLTLILGIPLIYIVLYLMSLEAIGDLWWLYVWLTLSIFTVTMMWIYPTFISPLFNKFKPLDNELLRNRIDSLLKRTGFKNDGIYVMDGSKRSAHGNAYFTGLGKSKRIVFFDTLLSGMEDREVEAILAHELGHFHHKHIRQRMATSLIFTLASLALLGYLINQDWFYYGLGISYPSNHTALVLFSLTLPVFSFFISPISNHFSRKHEFQADAFAAKHTDSNDLISSLIKLYRENSSSLCPDKYYSLFHDSHPSATLRIAELK